MVTYGDTSWAILLSTTEAAGAPTGDLFYFWAKRCEDLTRYTQKIFKAPSGKSFPTKSGEREQSVKVEAKILYPNDIRHNNYHINNLKTFLNTYHKLDGNALYFWYKALLGTGTPYTKFADENEAMVNFLKGYMKDVRFVTLPRNQPGLIFTFTEANS